MKKVGAFLVLFLLLFSLAPAFAVDNDTTNGTSPSPSSSGTPNDDTDDLEKGFECLEEKADDCSGLSIQEIALTILATPDNIFDDCVDELEDRQRSNHWGSVRDTSLAILALRHAGKDTEPAENWLIDQERTPTDLVWYLQEDSNEETECNIDYKTDDYTINIDTNKKIANSNTGPCLKRAVSNFWLEVSPSCYNEDIMIECDKNFISTVLYKNKNAATYFILDNTQSAQAYDTITLNVKSKCFGASSCDYEATAWAPTALLRTGHNVEEYIPYIIAMSDTNKGYLPDAFIYMLINYEDYASKLISDQKLGNHWEAPNSAYNQYYDTALALVALGSSSAEQITEARKDLFHSQAPSNGCWGNSIRDTAIVLWALSGRSGKASGGSGVTYCSEANYFCIPSFDCPSTENVGNNYFCASLSDTCCTSENLKSCTEYGGQECASDKVCVGNNRKAVDTTDCCTGTCGDRPQESECEANFHTCMNECSEFQEPMAAYSCGQNQVCCRTKQAPEGGSTWWIWVLIILIIIVLVAIIYLYREKLKLFWFKMRSKFKKDKGRSGGARRGPPRGPRPPMPPRPGFPPVRRPRAPVAPMRRRNYDKRDSAMSDTFKKLREMSS